MTVDIRNHIREFDRDYQLDPERVGQQRRPGVDSLRDGTYTFTILDAEADVVGDDKKPIVRLVLRVEGTDEVIEHVYWLNNQVSINILGQDLATLGIDSPQWVGRRSFSEELHQVLASKALRGRRFKAKKVTDQSKGKTYHRLYVNWGLGQSAGFSADSASPGRTTAGSTPANENIFDGAFSGADDDTIPF